MSSSQDSFLLTADSAPGGRNPPKKQSAPILAPVITIGFSTITADSANNFIIESKTLAPGSIPVAISGNSYPLKNSASALDVNGNAVLMKPSQRLGNIIDQAFGKLDTAQGQKSQPEFPTVITIDNQPITANSASQYIVQGQTLAAGAAPIIVAGKTYSLASSGSALVINGFTSTLPAASGLIPSFTSIITIGNQVITANSQSEFLVNAQILSPGGSALAIAGTTYSLAPRVSAIVVNGKTSPLQEPAPTVTIENQILTAKVSSKYGIDGQILSPGGPIAISGTTYNLALQASAIVINGKTTPLQEVDPTVTIGNQVLTANVQSEYVIEGQTLSPGGRPIAISGTTYSLALQASAIVINGKTTPLQEVDPTVTIGNQVLTANVQSEYVIEGQTLSPGGRPIAISGITYSLAAQASAIVVNGKTTPLEAASSAEIIKGTPISAKSEIIIGTQTAIAGGVAITVSGVIVSLPASGNSIIIGSSTEVLPDGPAPVLTIGSQIITASHTIEYLFGGQTLTPGGAVATISNVPISLAPGGRKVVIQGSTIDLTSSGATSTSLLSFTSNGMKTKLILNWMEGTLLASMLLIVLARDWVIVNLC